MVIISHRTNVLFNSRYIRTTYPDSLFFIFMLGIWADNEDEDSDDDQRPSKFSSKSKNYTAPVNFIAGGIHQPGKKPEETAVEKPEDEQETIDVMSDSSE